MRGRIRTIKPEAFSDELLWDLEEETGLPIFRGFVGLWTQCDREGRFEWRPRALKAAVLPFWGGDFGALLEALAGAGRVARYTVDGREFGLVVNFTKHQVINNRELASDIPAPPGDTTTRPPRVPHADKAEGKGKEGKGTEQIARELCEQERPTKARRLLLRGYQTRYEAACGDMWQSHDAYHRELVAIARWCAQPGDMEARVDCLLDGVFGDPWLADDGRRWPLGAVAKDPAKYHAAGRKLREKAAKAARVAEAQAKREREERERDDATKRDALTPEELRANREALSAALKGIGKAVG